MTLQGCGNRIDSSRGRVDFTLHVTLERPCLHCRPTYSASDVSDRDPGPHARLSIASGAEHCTALKRTIGCLEPASSTCRAIRASNTHTAPPVAAPASSMCTAIPTSTVLRWHAAKHSSVLAKALTGRPCLSRVRGSGRSQVRQRTPLPSRRFLDGSFTDLSGLCLLPASLEEANRKCLASVLAGTSYFHKATSPSFKLTHLWSARKIIGAILGYSTVQRC